MTKLPEKIDNRSIGHSEVLNHFLDSHGRLNWDKVRKNSIAFIGGLLDRGKDGAIVDFLRLLQSGSKEELIREIANRTDEYIRNGQIPQDHCNKKNGMESLLDLLKLIDDHPSDTEKIEAVRAMFWSVNWIDADEGKRIYRYHLMKIVLGLSSLELQMLKAFFNVGTDAKNGHEDFVNYTGSQHVPISSINKRLAFHLGFDNNVLLYTTEQSLISRQLIGKGDISHERLLNGNLSDLGKDVCEELLRASGCESFSRVIKI